MGRGCFMKWIDAFNENYYNRSDAAKQIDDLMKKNYKGHNYVPWSVMVRLLYTMDNDAELEVMRNENGGHVFTDMVETYSKIPDKKDPTSNVTTTTYTYAHFVMVKCTFLGKTFIENYPVQDNSYSATNYIDSNMINKSIQRAKAKVISTATGLGFMLYETGDLQFEDDNKPKNTGKRTVTTTTATPPKKDDVKVVDVSKDDETTDLAKYIKDNVDTIKDTMQKINVSMVKTYGVSLNPDVDTVDVLAEKLSKVSNVTIFGNSIKKMHETEMKGA